MLCFKRFFSKMITMTIVIACAGKARLSRLRLFKMWQTYCIEPV